MAVEGSLLLRCWTEADCVQSLQGAKEVAQSWEAQAQDALDRVEHLKGLLAEGVAWQAQAASSEETPAVSMSAQTDSLRAACCVIHNNATQAM